MTHVAPVLLDFESRSRADLGAVGGRKYWEHPSSEALVVVWYDTADGTVGAWYPGQAWPHRGRMVPLTFQFGARAEDPGYFEDVEEVWELREDRKWPTQAERSKMPHWQQMAVTRHENEAVLDAIRAGATSKGAIAQRTGLSCFDTTLVLRRLERAGLIEYT